MYVLYYICNTCQVTDFFKKKQKHLLSQLADKEMFSWGGIGDDVGTRVMAGRARILVFG